MGVSHEGSDKDNKVRAMEAAMGFIEKRYGKGSIMKLGSAPCQSVNSIPTGSISLDLALGVNGVPKGRIIEIFGPESSGKTTLMLSIIAQAQKIGEYCAFIDTEHTLDPSYAKKLGVNNAELVVSQPDYGEQALEILESLVRSGAFAVIVLDSVAALTPKAEIDGQMGDSHMGLQARLMSQALRKLTAIVSKADCMILFTNQIRMKIGVMFGSPETTTGGNALKFYSSIRLDIRKISQLKDGDNVIGNATQVKVVKNKIAPPFKKAQFDIMYGGGISREGEIIDIGSACSVIDKSGSWYSYKGAKLGQGRENVKTFLKENLDIAKSIENDIVKYYSNDKVDDFDVLEELSESKDADVECTVNSVEEKDESYTGA